MEQGAHSCRSHDHGGQNFDKEMEDVQQATGGSEVEEAHLDAMVEEMRREMEARADVYIARYHTTEDGSTRQSPAAYEEPLHASTGRMLTGGPKHVRRRPPLGHLEYEERDPALDHHVRLHGHDPALPTNAQHVANASQFAHAQNTANSPQAARANTERPERGLGASEQENVGQRRKVAVMEGTSNGALVLTLPYRSAPGKGQGQGGCSSGA